MEKIIELLGTALGSLGSTGEGEEGLDFGSILGMFGSGETPTP